VLESPPTVYNKTHLNKNSKRILAVDPIDDKNASSPVKKQTPTMSRKATRSNKIVVDDDIPFILPAYFKNSKDQKY
jgi:hypothetical protein